jgi:hypothetical protein
MQTTQKLGWDRRQNVALIAILFIASAVLVAKRIPVLLFLTGTNARFDTFEEIFWFAWPVIGTVAGIGFLVKDVSGSGGLLFHLFILYCGILYTVLSIVDIVTIVSFAGQGTTLLTTVADIVVAGCGWFGFFLYYD